MRHLHPLEPRQLFAAVAWDVSFSNAGTLDPTTRANLTSIVKDAANQWAALIPDERPAGTGTVTLTVDVSLSAVTTGPDASVSGASRHETNVGTAVNGIDVYDQSATARIRYGDPAINDGPDIQLLIDPTYLADTLWVDPNPDARTDTVPSDRVDAYSAILHEFGHVFFFNGFRDYNTYALIPDPTDGTHEQSTFDSLFTVTNGTPYFTGANAEAAYGNQPVPLTAGNPYHVGEASGAGSDLRSDLMNGIVFDRGVRYDLSAVDKAIAADLITAGTRPVIVEPPPDQPETFSFSGNYTYTSASGISVIITLKNGGAGRIAFPSSKTTQQDPTLIEILGTNKKTIVTVASNQPVNVPNLAIDGAVATVDTHLITLTGNVSLPAGATTLTIGAVSNATLTLGGTAAKTTSFGAISSPTLSLVTPATATTGSISSSTVTFTGGKSPALTFGAISNSALTIPANKKLTLASANGAVITSGAVTAMTAGGFSGTLQVNGNLTKAAFGSLSSATVAATGKTTTLAANAISGSSLSLGAVATLLVTTSLTGSTVTAASIKTLTAKAQISDSTITAPGGITTVNAGALVGSALTAGLSAPVTTYPTATPAFANAKAAIKTVKVASFSDTLLVAPTISTAALGTLTTANDGTAFGVYAHALSTLTATGPALSVKKKKLPFSTTSGDFAVTLA